MQMEPARKPEPPVGDNEKRPGKTMGKNWKTQMFQHYLGVSKNMGKPSKSSILIGFGTIISHPFWDTPIFGNIHLVSTKQYETPGDSAAKRPFVSPIVGLVTIHPTIARHIQVFQQKSNRAIYDVKEFEDIHVFQKTPK